MAFGPRSQGRIAGYPIGEDQSAGLKAILQPADCSPGPVMPVHIRGPSAPRDRDSRCGGATAPRKIGMNSGYHLGALPDGGGKATIARAASFAKSLASLLEKEKVAYDVGAYRDAPPGLRIWCGATVETKDVEALTPWLDFAYATAKADLAKG